MEYSDPAPLHLQGGPAVAAVRITDDDDVAITIGWDETEISVSEDAGSIIVYAQATTTADGAPQSDVSFSVSVSTRSGSAKHTSDFTTVDAIEPSFTPISTRP